MKEPGKGEYTYRVYTLPPTLDGSDAWFVSGFQRQVGQVVRPVTLTFLPTPLRDKVAAVDMVPAGDPVPNLGERVLCTEPVVRAYAIQITAAEHQQICEELEEKTK